MKKRNLEKLLKIRGITEQQRQKLLEFDRERAINGIAKSTRHSSTYEVVHLAQYVNHNIKRKPFEEMTKSDIQEYMATIAHYKSVNSKISIKQFFGWVHGMPRKTYPPCVSWISSQGKVTRKLPEEMLTVEEILSMAKSTFNLRDRAIVMVLYETGMRSHELIALKMKHWIPDKYGGRLQVPNYTKTGGRLVRVIDSLSDLLAWLNLHRFANDPDAALFPDIYTSKDHLSGNSTLALIIKQAATRAGIRKRVYLHLLRHSRATAMASKYTEQELKILFGWAAASTMPARYVHLSGDAVDKKVLRENKLLNGDEVEVNLTAPQKCARCQELNSSIATYCQRCSLPLKTEVIHARDRLHDLMQEQINGNKREKKKLMRKVEKIYGVDKLREMLEV